MIAHDPLPRSGRAELPHPAPTLGRDARAHERIRMTDSSRRKPARNVAPHAAPRQVITLAAMVQHRPPQIADCFAERTQRRAVHGHPVITEVAQQDRAQVRSLFPNGGVHAMLQFLLQGPQLGLPPLAHRLSQYREVPLPSSPATMRKTQEVERTRFAATPVSSIVLRIAAKLDDSRLVGMQLEAEPRESLAQFCQKLLGFPTMFEARDEIVSKTDEDHLSTRLLLFPSPEPEVECVVKIDVRQQRADTTALNRSYLTPHSLALFQHACLEPFLDQTHNAPIGYAVLDELHQPSLVESVVKLSDVSIVYPVHFSCSDPNRQRIQRLMWATFWSETVRESQKVRFVNCVQHCDGGTLDDLIFQRGNAEGAKLTRFTHLLDVHPANRLGSVGSSLESMGEILEVRLEVLTVVLPCLAVYACGRFLLSCIQCCPQSLHVVNVVEERREPLFLILRCCLSYPLERAARVFPALSPDRVTFGRVPLGQSPSLRRLRCRSLGLVRRLRRYYGPVRLPTSVHHRCLSFDFPTRSAVLSSADRRGISRFPVKVLAYMHGVSDRAESRYTLRWRCTRYCLPPSSAASASPEFLPLSQQGMDFTAQYPTCTTPCQRFGVALASGSA